MHKSTIVLSLVLMLINPVLAGRTNVETGENIPGVDVVNDKVNNSVNTTQANQQNSADTSLVGRVTNLKIQGLNNPILYFTIDNPAGCTTQPNAYFLTKSDPDYDYAFKALLASSISGREVKLKGIIGCPSPPVSVSAGVVRIVESSPQNGPIENKTADLNGIVTNLKIQQGVVYFRIASCSGSSPYFKFTASQLPGGFSLLLAAQSAKRQVEIFTTLNGSSACPEAGKGDIDLGNGGRALQLL